MIRIDRIHTYLVRVPERTDFRWLSLTEPLGEFVLARVEAEGTTGWGEVVALRDWGDRDGRRHGETPSTVTAVVHEQLGPWLYANDVEPGAVSARFDEVVVGHPYAKALLEMALLDLTGHLLGVPAYALLGGRARARVPVAHMIGILPLDECLREAVGAAADGVRALQVKGGSDPRRDAGLIRRLRAELGADVHLRLDANGGYAGRNVAHNSLQALAEAGADLVEQPVLGLDAMAECRRDSPLPLMADESCWTPGDALDVVRARAADALSVYVGKAGGAARARTVCAIAEAAHLPHDLNGGLELGIGNAANLHVALASPGDLMPSVIPVNAAAGSAPTKFAGHYNEDDVIRGALGYEDGSLLAPDGPGLGVEIDLGKVERYGVSHRESAREGVSIL